MRKLYIALFSLVISMHSSADSFYVAYEWMKPNGDLMRSWNTGFINEDIDTEKGIKALIQLLKTEKKIKSTVVILYLRKLKTEQAQKKNKKPRLNGLMI